MPVNRRQQKSVFIPTAPAGVPLVARRTRNPTPDCKTTHRHHFNIVYFILNRFLIKDDWSKLTACRFSTDQRATSGTLAAAGGPKKLVRELFSNFLASTSVNCIFLQTPGACSLHYITEAHPLSTFSIFLPFASSSTSLSK